MEYIDLTHPISNKMSTYPSDPDVTITREKDIINNNSLLHSFKMGTHTGTHLDVPAHIIEDGKMINDFSVGKFTGIAIKIDESSYSTLDDISYEIDGIIYDTGWYNFFSYPEKFYGSDRPIIPKDVIDYALKKEVKFFGCDLPSIDQSGSVEKEIHNALLGSNIIIYESLTNLDQLPTLKQFNFYGFPLPFHNLEGSPVRAVGIL